MARYRKNWLSSMVLVSSLMGTTPTIADIPAMEIAPSGDFPALIARKIFPLSVETFPIAINRLMAKPSGKKQPKLLVIRSGERDQDNSLCPAITTEPVMVNGTWVIIGPACLKTFLDGGALLRRIDPALPVSEETEGEGLVFLVTPDDPIKAEKAVEALALARESWNNGRALNVVDWVNASRCHLPFGEAAAEIYATDENLGALVVEPGEVISGFGCGPQEFVAAKPKSIVPKKPKTTKRSVPQETVPDTPIAALPTEEKAPDGLSTIEQAMQNQQAVQATQLPPPGGDSTAVPPDATEASPVAPKELANVPPPPALRTAQAEPAGQVLQAEAKAPPMPVVQSAPVEAAAATPKVVGLQSPVSGLSWDELRANAQTASNGSVNFQASAASTAQAMNDGEVVFAGPVKGHGHMVSVKQADGRQAVYANLTGVQVKAGEKVNVGQILGNLDEKSGLTLQVREGADVVDPFAVRTAGGV